MRDDANHMNLTVIDVPHGEQLVCEDSDVQPHSLRGFRIVATFLALGEVTIRVPSTREGASRYDRDDIVKEGPVRRFVMVRDAESAIAVANKRAEDAEARMYREIGETNKVKKELETLQNASSDARVWQEQCSQARLQRDKLEKHLAYVRTAIGSERFAEIVTKAESEEVPF